MHHWGQAPVVHSGQDLSWPHGALAPQISQRSCVSKRCTTVAPEETHHRCL